MYRFDCDLCAEILETSSVAEMKDRGRTHLSDHHYGELEGAFREAYRGKRCDGGCGSVVPSETPNGSGFECPTCGHNHFSQFAGRYLWWRLEVE